MECVSYEAVRANRVSPAFCSPRPTRGETASLSFQKPRLYCMILLFLLLPGGWMPKKIDSRLKENLATGSHLR